MIVCCAAIVVSQAGVDNRLFILPKRGVESVIFLRALRFVVPQLVRNTAKLLEFVIWLAFVLHIGRCKVRFVAIAHIHLFVATCVRSSDIGTQSGCPVRVADSIKCW